MSRKRYPLEALQELRREQAGESALRLGEKLPETERARAAHTRSRQLLEAEQGRRERALAAERALLEEGALSAADLARAEAFRRASIARSEQLAERERKARAELGDALHQEERAREELAQKDAEAKLMDRHRKDWQDAALRLAERAEEEAILDQWTNKRHGKKLG